jgi:CelD/BcsL family acetyltransferase involved in cellulose biosynthesis
VKPIAIRYGSGATGRFKCSFRSIGGGNSGEGYLLTTLQQVDPLQDARWEKFLEGNPKASVFHSREWLEALHKTYGYTPIVYTTAALGNDLQDGLVICEVESWVTGRRLVSLPFSDHCEPLINGTAKRAAFSNALIEQSLDAGWRYVELRPRFPIDEAVSPFYSTESYSFHELDLAPDCEVLFRGFHKSSTQRKIRRAEREGLTYQDGSAYSLLETFYHLNMMTRRRQGLPPQPRTWFRNLIDCFGEALTIRVANKGAVPIAAILTIQYKDTVTYKYGCSDARFHNLGGIHLLLWKAIKQAKERGLHRFDLGRSDADNNGLITFKTRWGAKQSTLTYLRYAAKGNSRNNFIPARADWRVRLARRIFSHTPNACLPALGSLLYRHVG